MWRSAQRLQLTRSVAEGESFRRLARRLDKYVDGLRRCTRPFARALQTLGYALTSRLRVAG